LVDPQEQFETTIVKWGQFAKTITQDGNSLHPCNDSTCKDNWGSIYDDFKRIHDYMQSNGHNETYGIGI
jgi:hypothetical protein